MPRQLRIEYAGAIYHVMNRGDRREPIFHDDLDRKRFVAALGEVCAKTDWQVYAYCLMNNHFHLVMETPNANLAAQGGAAIIIRLSHLRNHHADLRLRVCRRVADFSRRRAAHPAGALILA